MATSAISLVRTPTSHSHYGRARGTSRTRSRARSRSISRSRSRSISRSRARSISRSRSRSGHPIFYCFYYYCKKCDCRWRVVRTFGKREKCRRCKNNRPYHKYKKLIRKFGEFRCRICKRYWKSGNSWEGISQKCNQCNIMIYPFSLRRLRSSSLRKGRPPHDVDRCGMCHLLNCNCEAYNTRSRSSPDEEYDDEWSSS